MNYEHYEQLIRIYRKSKRKTIIQMRISNCQIHQGFPKQVATKKYFNLLVMCQHQKILDNIQKSKREVIFYLVLKAK